MNKIPCEKCRRFVRADKHLAFCDAAKSLKIVLAMSVIKDCKDVKQIWMKQEKDNDTM